MMMNVVALAAEESMTWGERASIAGIVSLQGMVAVFAVLAILWGLIEIMHRLLRKEKKDNNADAPAPAASVAPATDDAAVAAAIAAAMAANDDDGAVVAAITAAVSAAMAEDGYTGGFRVVSFKRVGKTGSRRGF